MSINDKSDLDWTPIAKVGDDAEPADVFAQLLEGLEDDERAVEPTDDDLGTLEEEWQRVCAAKEAKERAEAIAAKAKEVYNAAKQRMADAMERQGTRQFRGANGSGCSRTETYTTSVEDPEAFMAWVKETHPELLSVHSGARTKFIREEYRDQGVPEDDPSFPPGLKPGTITGLQVRGTRPQTEQQGD